MWNAVTIFARLPNTKDILMSRYNKPQQIPAYYVTKSLYKELSDPHTLHFTDGLSKAYACSYISIPLTCWHIISIFYFTHSYILALAVSRIFRCIDISFPGVTKFRSNSARHQNCICGFSCRNVYDSGALTSMIGFLTAATKTFHMGVKCSYGLKTSCFIAGWSSMSQQFCTGVVRLMRFCSQYIVINIFCIG